MTVSSITNTSEIVPTENIVNVDKNGGIEILDLGVLELIAGGRASLGRTAPSGDNCSNGNCVHAF